MEIYMPRADLSKVMCERERRGGGTVKGRHKVEKVKTGVVAWPYKGESTSPHPMKIGIKRPYANRTKTFNENLNPLLGLLHKSVGRHWDKVYSEICQIFDKRKVINQHILIHLFQIVETHAFMEAGKVYVLNERGWGVERKIPVQESGAEYYVHPLSGVLFSNKRKNWKAIAAQAKKEQDKEEANYLQVLGRFNNKNGPGVRYAIKISDVWYEISVVKIPEPTKHRRIGSHGETEYFTRFPEVDAVSIHGAKVMPIELHSKMGFYVCRKEQLNKKRIKELKLN